MDTLLRKGEEDCTRCGFPTQHRTWSVYGTRPHKECVRCGHQISFASWPKSEQAPYLKAEAESKKARKPSKAQVEEFGKKLRVITDTALKHLDWINIQGKRRRQEMTVTLELVLSKNASADDILAEVEGARLSERTLIVTRKVQSWAQLVGEVSTTIDKIPGVRVSSIKK